MTDAATISAAGDPGIAPTSPEGGDAAPARSLSQDAWRQLRRNPIFWVSVVLITVFLLMAIVPQLFTSKDPEYGDLYSSMLGPGEKGSLFGYDLQGYDIYARCVYGARASIMVGAADDDRDDRARRSFVGRDGRLLWRLARRGPVPHHRHLLRHPAAARRHPLHERASRRAQRRRTW